MASTEVMKNKPYDEAVDLSDDESEESVPDQPERSAMGAESNDFEFADEFSSQDQSPQKGAGAQVVQNQHFDEAVDLSDSESVDDTDSPSKSSAAARSPAPAPAPAPAPIPARQPPPQAQQSPPGTKSTADDKDEDDDEEGDSDEDESGSSSSESEAGAMQGYNPADYAHLQVSSEVKDLFAYITRFTPTVIELDTKLKPFVPEYIPAVGEIDAFLKVHTLFAEVHSPQIPRPDGKPEPLGLSVLDEPGPVQTDPTVLDLELRSITRQTNLQPVTVAAIENAAQNPKAITDWIKSINDLHSKNPPPNVNYTKPMPDIDALMQVWPQELEEAMGELQLPTAELDVDITAYTRIICALLDIPVHTNLIESLHVLFTLYSEFKGNQHFNDASNGGLGGFGAPGMGGL